MPEADISVRLAHFSGRSFLSFLLVGSISTAVHYLVMALLFIPLGSSATASSTIGFLFSAAVNYLLNKKFTFSSTQEHKTSAPRFLMTAVCGLLLNYLLLSLLLTLGLAVLPAQIFSTIGVIAWNYCIHSVWTFRTARA